MEGNGISRRQFLGIALCIPGTILLGGCTQNKKVSWTAIRDDSLEQLSIEVAKDKKISMPSSGWKKCDDYIQLQVAHSTNPGYKIGKISRKRGTLTVRLDSNDPNVESETKDIEIAEYKISGPNMDKVAEVIIDDDGQNTTAFNVDSLSVFEGNSKQ